MVKITKLTKIYGGNARSDHVQIQSRNRVKLPFIDLTRYMHKFYCESSLHYGDCKNSKTYQYFW